MAQLWNRLAAGELGRFSLVAETAAALESAAFPIAFQRAVERASRQGLLTADNSQLLLEFGEGCGRLGLTGQVAHICAYRQQITLAADTAREQATAKGQVYQMLGVAGGVGLSLLLL
jgi:stage III sporulation protein AB